MRCVQCNGEVPTARFCSNCGASLGLSSVVRNRDEFDLDWLSTVLVKLGFTVEPRAATDGGTSTIILVRHNEQPNYVIDYRYEFRVILVTSWWGIKPPGFLGKNELFKTINSLNNKIICAQCSVSENDLSSLEIQTSFFLTDSIAEVDIAAFMEFSAVLVRRVMSQERLKSYV